MILLLQDSRFEKLWGSLTVAWRMRCRPCALFRGPFSVLCGLRRLSGSSGGVSSEGFVVLRHYIPQSFSTPLGFRFPNRVERRNGSEDRCRVQGQASNNGGKVADASALASALAHYLSPLLVHFCVVRSLSSISSVNDLC